MGVTTSFIDIVWFNWLRSILIPIVKIQTGSIFGSDTKDFQAIEIFKSIVMTLQDGVNLLDKEQQV